MIELGYIKAFGIDYKGTLPKIKKNEIKLQPVFEALTNSLEAISFKDEIERNEYVTIRLNLKKNLLSNETNEYDFNSFQVEDNGIGFTDSEFNRIVALNDNRKGFSNKGTGRVQYLHYFDKTTISSRYNQKNVDNTYRVRKFELSKKKPFLDENAIIKYISNEISDSKENKTTVTFKDPLDSKDFNFYSNMTIADLKSEIISHFLVYLCENRNSIPAINIEIWRDENLYSIDSIGESDIPKVDYETEIKVNYRRISNDGKSTEKISKNSESFKLKSFIITKSDLNKNELLLTSKGQKAENISLYSLEASDHINGNRFLFLLSGEYLDSKDSDTRGNISIPNIESFKKNAGTLFETQSIVIEDLEKEANEAIQLFYAEIKEKNILKEKNLNRLKEMFLLNEETINSLKIGLNESDDQILKKVYEADVKIIAKKDAEIKKQIQNLEKLNTASTNYKQELEDSIVELVKTIPVHNRTTLTHYVARRKLVLDLFDKILEKQLESLKNFGRIDENLMHNLIFQQSSNDPSDSDLWLINEEFIYFEGFSETHLKNVSIRGIKIFKDEFEVEEERYLNSLGNKRLDRRPDILLFPEDGKCVIIELKAPEVNASFHLTQIDMYASLIRNYTKDEFQITRFYGYLIGENIEPRDVLGTVSNYEESPNFKYLFRPSTKVIGFDGRSNGSIYSEVIKYSTLLERAKLRNKVFIDKLTD